MVQQGSYGGSFWIGNHWTIHQLIQVLLPWVQVDVGPLGEVLQRNVSKNWSKVDITNWSFDILGTGCGPPTNFIVCFNSLIDDFIVCVPICEDVADVKQS